MPVPSADVAGVGCLFHKGGDLLVGGHRASAYRSFYGTPSSWLPPAALTTPAYQELRVTARAHVGPPAVASRR
jgi:hypothetical protein